MQARYGVLQRVADFVDDQLAAARRHRLLLLLQFPDRLLDAPPRVLANVRAVAVPSPAGNAISFIRKG
jgi:hypothetical protein